MWKTQGSSGAEGFLTDWRRWGLRASLSSFLVTSKSANIVATLDAFAPGSRGNYRLLAQQTIETVRRLPGVLSQLAEFTEAEPNRLEPLTSWSVRTNNKRTEELGVLFNAYGSDKARHGYHNVYSAILKKTGDQQRILEVGLGTNNVDVLSHMGAEGQPGASLRAFRDFCPNALLWGADVDQRILNRPGFVGDFILWKRGWSHGQTRQAWPEIFSGRKGCSGSDGEDVEG